MATPEQIEQMLTVIKECTETPTNTLVKNPKWGEISFEQSVADLDRLFDILQPLETYREHLSYIPDNVVQQTVNVTETIKNTIGHIREFTLTEGDPSTRRDQIVAELKTQIDALVPIIATWLPYLAYQHGDIRKNLEQIESSIKDAKALVDDGDSYVSGKREEIDGIVAAARDASASAGVAHFTGDFSKEAETNEITAQRWLIAGGISATATLVAAIVLFFWLRISPDAKLAEVAQIGTTKLVVLGVLFTATVWFGRMYRAAKHQSAINKHRANALKTFQAFIEATSNEATRNAVLLETTRSIFALAPMGYLSVERGESHSVTEVVKNISSSSLD